MFDLNSAKIFSGLVGGGAAGVLFLLALYVFRDTILAALNRSVQRDIESRRAKFQKDLEDWKSELEQQKERLKHDLAKEALKSEILTRNTHELYARLFELMRHAEGAVGILTGMRMLPDWRRLSDDEITKILLDKGARKIDIEEALKKVDRTNSARGFESIHDLFFEMDHFIANKTTTEVKNFAILKELYLSEEVRKRVFSLISLFISIRVDSELGKMDRTLQKQARDSSKQIEPAMNDLMTIMRRELGGNE